ncbi:DNA repair protein RadA [Streptomonospora nanhaiensis]|uniref:DNA repair protein RadA n=1 Tax=Streptomonospora nanhaiensis TaxID=1323731 RepID=A0A853BN08_9ACTN|nr:DNA repair protein RadA [Streptomonospora nanhaiensis]MBV2361771.1 DNA repair protein RadA [Streptomonospora nanhaiensis]MBX9388017.1 DNA repair protein RadA [Streptomonospora nanhaiensis]NYI96410.1 DNA repair protein RadA/Sms [Streptomonospora nanhaiensis]
MAKAAKTTFRCAECGWTTFKWVGRCGECQAWGTVEEAGAPTSTVIAPARVTAPAQPITDISVEAAHATPTGLDELDRVLGGGVVPGGVMLLAGEPGVGKSTLLLEVAALCAEAGPVLYVTGEESTGQVRLRAERLGALSPKLYLAAETSVAALVSHVDAVAPSLLIVDSVQTMVSPDVSGVPGGVTQVREVAGALIRLAKERGIATVLVGHVTKDGSIAGPRLLEHLVDVVLQFEGDRHSQLRMLRAVKNRYGPTDEIGCFELTDSGIIGLPDPSGLFLTRRNEPVPGTCVTVTLEGRRPLIAEVQALVASSNLPQPRRATSGLDTARVNMVMAVLERRARVRIANADVYASTVGGVRLGEPSVDLALALAVAGSVRDEPLPRGLVAIGEVGLAGDVRAVSAVQRRLAEAQRLGFTRAIVPRHSEEPVEGIETVGVDDVAAALRAAFPARQRAE